MIRQVSKKQAQKNRAVAKIKSELSPFCFICHRHTVVDAAHLLPRSTEPQYYTEPWNIVGMCRECHNLYDNNLSFRQQQKHIYEIIKQHDEQAAYRYFKI